MYEKFFALSRRPFSVHPDPNVFFPLPAHQEILAALRDCVEHVVGIGLLVGESGLGKSLLCRLLVQELAPVLQGVLLAHSNLPSKRALLQAILFEMRQPYLGMDEQESRLALIHCLQSRPATDPSLLLVVDEAHGLQPELLEELRLLTNWTSGIKPLIRVVLAGQPLLEELLSGAQADQLNQRIARRVYLPPLIEEETARYVDYRLRWAGAQAGHIFTAEALEAIHRATDGVPRSINLLCDQVLLLACKRRTAPITAALVKEAWGELQQLPASWDYAGTSPGETLEASSGVVEFGSPEEPLAGAGRDAPAAEPVGCGEEFDDLNTAEFGGAMGGLQIDSSYEAADDADVFDPHGAISEAVSTEPRADEAARCAGGASGQLRAGSDACGCTCIEEHADAAGRHVAVSGEAARVDEQPFRALPESLAEHAWELDPSPLDVPFDEEEKVWDQYAALDAQTPPAFGTVRMPALDFSGAHTPCAAVNGAGSGGATMRRARKSSAAAEPASPDCRRLFSKLRK